MGFEINSPADEQLLAVYTGARNKVREIITYGVYPHARQAIEAYDQLDALVVNLSQGTGNQPVLAAYHGALMAAIASEISELRAIAESLVASIETIETLQPGVFGIELPPTPGN